MPGQTTNGFPYPLPTDPIPNAPGTIQSLAQKADDSTAALGGDVAGLDTRIDNVNTRLDDTDAGLADAVENIDGLDTTVSFLDERVDALEARPVMPPGPLTFTSVTGASVVDPSDAFIGESLRWARFGALAVVLVTGALRDVNAINASYLGIQFATTAALPAHARPAFVNVEQTVSINATNATQVGIRCAVQIQSGGAIYVKNLTMPEGATVPSSPQISAVFVYPAAGAAPA